MVACFSSIQVLWSYVRAFVSSEIVCKIFGKSRLVEMRDRVRSHDGALESRLAEAFVKRLH